MLALLRVIANPLDEEALLGALSSPAFGVSPDALWLLRRAAGGRSLHSALLVAAGAAELELDEPVWLEHLPASDREALASMERIVAELREAGTRLALERLIERALSASGYDLAVLMRRPGRMRMANVRKLMRMARDLRGGRGPRPARLPRVRRAARRPRRRGGRRHRGRGPRRRSGDDDPQRQGPRVRGRRGAFARPPPARGHPPGADARPPRRGTARGRAAAGAPRRRVAAAVRLRPDQGAHRGARLRGGAPALLRRRDPGQAAADPQRDQAGAPAGAGGRDAGPQPPAREPGFRRAEATATASAWRPPSRGRGWRRPIPRRS